MWPWKKSPNSDGYDVARREFKKLCETGGCKHEYLNALQCLNNANDWQKCKDQVNSLLPTERLAPSIVENGHLAPFRSRSAPPASSTTSRRMEPP